MNLVILSPKELNPGRDSNQLSQSSPMLNLKKKSSNLSPQQGVMLKNKLDRNNSNDKSETKSTASNFKGTSHLYPSAPILKGKKHLSNGTIFNADRGNKQNLSHIKSFTDTTFEANNKLAPAKQVSDKSHKASKRTQDSTSKFSIFSKEHDTSSQKFLTIDTESSLESEHHRSSQLSFLPQISPGKSPKLRKPQRSEAYETFFHKKKDREDKYFKILLNKEDTELDDRHLKRNYSELKLYETYRAIDKMKFSNSEDLTKNPATAMLTTSYERNLLPRTFGLVERKDDKHIKIKLR
jgi:hypothetical protein